MYVMTGGQKPSADAWLSEAKKSPNAGLCGMFLIHNGVVRVTAKKDIYEPGSDSGAVTAMAFDADLEKAEKAAEETLERRGVYQVRVWLAGPSTLGPGDDIMQVMIGADCRDNCLEALTALVKTLKTQCVTEREIH